MQRHPDKIVVEPADLPLRVVLRVPDRDGRLRDVPYLLRYTRRGRMLLNRDESVPPSTAR